MAQTQSLQVQEKKELTPKEEKTVPARYYVPNADVYETEDALVVVMRNVSAALFRPSIISGAYVSHAGLNFFRGSMAAGLYPPLPTLRRHPHECRRTARGRGGSLRLPRGGLAPPTPCRSPGALRLSSS